MDPSEELDYLKKLKKQKNRARRGAIMDARTHVREKKVVEEKVEEKVDK